MFNVKEHQQALFKAIINSSDDAIISKTLNGIITSWNPGAEKIFGYTETEVIGKHISLIIPAERTDEEGQIIQKIKQGEYVKHFETQRLRKDGNLIDISLTISPVKDDEGNIIGVSKIARDISDYNLSKESLHASLKEITDYKFALDESAIVAITDQKGIINYVNDNFCKISKYSRKELIGQDHRIINSAYHPKEFIRNLWVTIANGKIWRGELKNKAKDGTFYWVDTTIVPFLNNEGKPYQYVAIRADITERKKGEERITALDKEIAKSEKIYKTIATSIPGSIISLFDSEFRIVLIEGDLLEKLGFAKGNLIGNKAKDVIPPDVYANTGRALERALKGETFTRETTTINGYDLLTRFVPLYDDQNKIFGVMTVGIDITEINKAHKAIAELNIGLEKKVVERTAQLYEVNKELDAFTYSVSHDLRAPLRAVNGYAQILEEDYDALFDAEGKRLLTEVQRNARRMGILIDDLLAFSRLGRKEIATSLVNMNELTAEVISGINESTQHQAKINVHNLLPAMADRSLIQHVMFNLVSNAVKYSAKKDNPIVEITSRKENNDIIYTVCDNGAGFDMDYAGKLFGVFQRLHSQEEFEGTGVGLAIVQRIIHKHGGKIWAEGEVGKGATFYFSLPLSKQN